MVDQLTRDAPSSIPSQAASDASLSARRVDEVGGFQPYAKAGVAKKLHKANVRKWLAYSLIAVFAVEIMLAFGSFMFLAKPIMEIKELLLEVIGPTSALVGSIFGFYFGSFDANDE